MFIDDVLVEAKKAFDSGEIPVGAVIVENNQIISRGYNLSMKDNITNHAEIIAINEAISKKKDWRLNNCDLYVTMEPCPMCAGAILQARIKNVYIGTKSNIVNNGEVINNIFNNPNYYHQTNVVYLNNDECAKLLTDFFKKKRK